MKPADATAALAIIACAWRVSPRVDPSPISVQESRASGLLGLWRSLGYTVGAEIGVEQGRFSERICQAIPGVHLLCVDAWEPYAGYRDHVGQAKLDGFYDATVKRLAPYDCQIVKAFSTDAAARVAAGSLDFVHIDGNHTLAHVIADIAAWAPKVRRGGIVSGHDFGRASVGQVREAVVAWTTAHAIAPWFVLTGDRSPSWMWVV